MDRSIGEIYIHIYILKTELPVRLSVCHVWRGDGGGSREGGQEGGGNREGGISQMECLGEDTFPEQCWVT